MTAENTIAVSYRIKEIAKNTITVSYEIISVWEFLVGKGDVVFYSPFVTTVRTHNYGGSSTVNPLQPDPLFGDVLPEYLMSPEFITGGESFIEYRKIFANISGIVAPLEPFVYVVQTTPADDFIEIKRPEEADMDSVWTDVTNFPNSDWRPSNRINVADDADVAGFWVRRVVPPNSSAFWDSTFALKVADGLTLMVAFMDLYNIESYVNQTLYASYDQGLSRTLTARYSIA